MHPTCASNGCAEYITIMPGSAGASVDNAIARVLLSLARKLEPLAQTAARWSTAAAVSELVRVGGVKSRLDFVARYRSKWDDIVNSCMKRIRKAHLRKYRVAMTTGAGDGARSVFRHRYRCICQGLDDYFNGSRSLLPLLPLLPLKRSFCAAGDVPSSASEAELLDDADEGAVDSLGPRPAKRGQLARAGDCSDEEEELMGATAAAAPELRMVARSSRSAAASAASSAPLERAPKSMRISLSSSSSSSSRPAPPPRPSLSPMPLRERRSAMAASVGPSRRDAVSLTAVTARSEQEAYERLSNCHVTEVALRIASAADPFRGYVIGSYPVRPMPSDALSLRLFTRVGSSAAHPGQSALYASRDFFAGTILALSREIFSAAIFFQRRPLLSEQLATALSPIRS